MSTIKMRARWILLDPTNSEALTASNLYYSTTQTVKAKIDEVESTSARTDLSNVANSTVLNKVKAVDGSGSGLDADTLDGIQGAQFIRSDVDDAFYGTLTWDKGGGVVFQFDSDLNHCKQIAVNDGSGNFTIKHNWSGQNQYIRSSSGAAKISIDADQSLGSITLTVAPVGTAGSAISTTYSLLIKADGTFTWMDNKVWHAGNDGAGSGLDADTVDGLQASQFVRSDIATTANQTVTFNNGIVVKDEANFTNANIFWGADSDAALLTFHHYDTDKNWLTLLIADNDTSSAATADAFRLAFVAKNTYSDMLDASLWQPIVDFYSSKVETWKTILPHATEQIDVGSSTQKFRTMYAVTFNGTATQATYADLAEKYTVLGEPEVGDVILISEGDAYDCEISSVLNSYRVLGVVSENPAYMMNSDLENGTYIALKGRVKCKVVGPVRKGEPLISASNGCACGIFSHPGLDRYYIFAKALETIDTNETRTIEVVVI